MIYYINSKDTTTKVRSLLFQYATAKSQALREQHPERYCFTFKLTIRMSHRAQGYTISTFESALQYLDKSKWFSLLDHNLAFLQISLDEESKKYTSFICPFGQFQYNFLPLSQQCHSTDHSNREFFFEDIKYKFLFSFLTIFVFIVTGPSRTNFIR